MKRFLNHTGAIIGIIAFYFLMEYFIFQPSIINSKVEKIEDSFKGEIIEIYAVRNTPPTHIKLKSSDKIIKISPSKQFIENAEVGDSVIKKGDETSIYLKKDNQIEEFTFIELSPDNFDHRDFPKHLKKKLYNEFE
ncbi:hypothetical protein LB465_03220 [Salegentibacter sp. LM13S]|uniref:hypothetical protein n=1 Tax=Salegentibacter lacus TaxID=2873599 RepID=UPI001CCBDA34|nr:hypothetical protein [Salegentibacter lacus]MBZ9629778.1 hypothetical protein [Salegentibacter lacus]